VESTGRVPLSRLNAPFFDRLSTLWTGHLNPAAPSSRTTLGHSSIGQTIKSTCLALLCASIASAQSFRGVNSVNTIKNASYCPDTSIAANTITCSTSIGFVGYVAGQAVDVLVANTATGATTINVNSLGAKAVTYNGATAITTNILYAGGTYRFQYDGTEFVLQGSVGSGGGGGSGGGITVYSGAAALSGTQYFPIGGGDLPSTTEANVYSQAPIAATVTNFTANLSAAPGAGNSVAFTWRDNASSQSVTCTIATAATTCSDLTHSFTAAQLDNLDIQAVTTGTIAGTPVVTLNAQFGTVGSNGTVTTGTINQTAYYSAAGTAVSGGGPGTAGQCWTSNGVGSPPTFQACGGGGGSSSPNIATITRPVAASFSWVNQGGATLATTGGGLSITAVGAAGTNVRAQVMSPGTVPFKCQELVTVLNPAAGGVARAGAVMRESSTGKMLTIASGGGATWQLLVDEFSSPTAFFTTALAIAFTAPDFSNGFWVQAAYDGTNVTWSLSPDGVTYSQVYTQLNTSFFTVAPDQCGIFFDSEGTGNFPQIVTLLSFNN
jgi:hypothetical protein